MNDKKIIMDAFDAPQWTDFTCSPQVSDDFFSRLHPEHELEYQRRQLFSTKDESDFEKVLSDIDSTPVKVLSPSNKIHKDKKTAPVKETTVNNLLLEAMNNLELSGKKGRLNKSIANSSINTCKTPNTGSKRITRSMSARKNIEYYEELSSSVKENEFKLESPLKKVSTNNVDNILQVENPIEYDSSKIDSEHCKSEKLMPSRIVTSFEKRTKNTLIEKNIVQEIQIHETISINTESSNTETNEQLSDEDIIDEIDSTSTELKPSRIVTSFNLGKPKETKKPEVAVKKRPHFLTSIRRQSLAKQKRDPYVSLAEAVSKFQKGTPKRFHSVSTKNPKPKLTTKQESLKITRPVSPVLTSKNRIRPIKPVNNDKIENQELKKIRNGPVKADPKAISNPKKLITTKNVLKIPTTTSLRPKKDQHSSTESLSKSQSLHDSQYLKTDQPIQKKVVPTIVSTEDTKLAVKEVEIGHFGIPTESCKPKKFTRTLPFSFEVRNKELQEKKERKLKKLQLTENVKKTEIHSKPFTRREPEKMKTEFLLKSGLNRAKEPEKKTELKKIEVKPQVKAQVKKIESKKTEIKKIEVKKTEVKKTDVKSVPNYPKKEPTTIKTRITPLKTAKETSSAKKTTPRPFSFEQRDKQLIKKKEEFIKETLEKEKKGREFHANPVPEFRPVIIRGRSRENIRLEEKTPKKNVPAEKVISKPRSCTFKSQLFKSRNEGDQENKNPVKQRSNSASRIEMKKKSLYFGSDSKIDILSELNTNKRAKDRKEYYDKLKRKEIEEEALRRKEEEERLCREKAEIIELRKMTETKARPMPQYKPMIVIKSKKLLTDPQSPAWAYKKP